MRKDGYEGLKGCTNYRKAIQIIKDGGYATDTRYVSKICSIIERWNLSQYDLAENWYRVRKSWADEASQISAFTILANAKAAADANSGYSVFDHNGKKVYTPPVDDGLPEPPFMVNEIS